MQLLLYRANYVVYCLCLRIYKLNLILIGM